MALAARIYVRRERDPIEPRVNCLPMRGHRVSFNRNAARRDEASDYALDLTSTH
jgi:hypothetical protein